MKQTNIFPIFIFLAGNKLTKLGINIIDTMLKYEAIREKIQYLILNIVNKLANINIIISFSFFLLCSNRNFLLKDAIRTGENDTIVLRRLDPLAEASTLA